MTWSRPITASSTIALLLCLPLFVLAAEAPAPRWQPYDESAELASLAEHETERMRFMLLNSKVLDKNSLWQPFTDDLAGFASRYEELKPQLLDANIAAIQNSVAAGQFSYEELTKFYLYRIRAIETDRDNYLNGIIALNPNAIAEARALDQRRIASNGATSIHGIPVLLKDNIGFADLPTTAGALALADNTTADAFIVERLRQGNAIILGKTNLSEWAYFFCGECPSGYSAMGGQTLNPYGRFQFGTGGSSSGTGAAIAANYATIGVGSETSGSILSPASANSLVGLKPTTGSLSRSGIVPISARLDTAGPMGHSVADVVALFNAMAGYDETDTAMPLLAEDFRLQYRQIDLQDKRLGTPLAYLDNPLFTAALSQLSSAGALAIELELPDIDTDDFVQLLGGDMVRDLAAYLSSWAADEVTVASIQDIQRFNAAESGLRESEELLRELQELRAPYGQALIDMMAELELSDAELQAIAERLQSAASAALNDLFVTHQLDVLLSINNFNAAIAALANYPALTIPMGYTEEGRPMGLTLIAPSFREQDLIDIAAAYERLNQARRLPDGYQ
ncbi:MAG: amidase family protein [Pseudohongiellaceae bacterium]